MNNANKRTPDPARASLNPPTNKAQDLDELVKEWFFEEDQQAEAKAVINQIIANQVAESAEGIIAKSIEVMREIMVENFHYRLMCGEIKDPDGKIDVHKAFIEYQELEPERVKFSQYIEERRATLKAGGK